MRRLMWIALLVTGCFSWESSDGVSERNGTMYSDGKELPHSRWVALAVPEDLASLTLASATRDIVLGAGGPELEVQVWSEVDGDGTVSLDGDEPVVRSTAGKIAILNGVRGRLPPAVKLTIASGTGDVELADREGRIHVKNGTGDCKLRDCRLASLSVDSGTGDIELQDCEIQELQGKLGTGDCRLRASRVRGGDLKSGTGDVVLAGGSDMGPIRPQLGTGEVRRDG